MKRFISICCAFVFALSFGVNAEENLACSAKSVLLMEASTQKVLYENNADEQLPIASVTKIMTMLLIMEAVEDGKIQMEDMVNVSERAMSMGGSTMFLEAGETLSVYEILKGIAVASANDGCVAMAEFLSGSVEGFVEEMNNKAQELGMTNTNFINTNGLDAQGHYSSARDVAVMSAELLKHEKIFEFTTIWTDKMHDGKYDLANTNKLIRFYPGANGLKTGSTSNAQCCLSATAKRDDMQLIAVVLGAPTSKERFNDARTLLDYGFANYRINTLINEGEEICKLPVKKGDVDLVSVKASENFKILESKSNKTEYEKKILLPEFVKAPINCGELMGKLEFYADGEKKGEVGIESEDSVSKKSFGQFVGELLRKLFS